MESPAERYAYVAALAPDGKSRSDALLVVDVDAASGSYAKIVGQLDQTSGTNCTISDGTPAVPPFVPMRRIHTWNDATLSYLDYAPAAFIL